MGIIASCTIKCFALPFHSFSWFSNYFTTLLVRRYRIVLGVPSTIPLSFNDFVKHFSLWVNSLLPFYSNKPKSLMYEVDDKNILIGYSCRSLFETALNVLKSSPQYDSSKGKSLRIAATPIHHKSYTAIMEKMTDSIDIIPLNETKTEIVIDRDVEEIIKKCDVIVITHLFGQSFDLRELIELKNRYNKILIVDGVMGGCRKESQNVIGIDLDIYSTGQDKRPVALGGGYCIARHEAFAGMEKEILSYRVVSRFDRLKKILNTFCLRTLYEHRPLQLLMFVFLRTFSIKLSSVTSSVRKSNPGFDSDNYLLCPNDAMVNSLKIELPNIQEMEDKYVACWRRYLSLLPDEIRETFYPFYRLHQDVILPYNQILLPNRHEDSFLAFCDEHFIGCLDNQNYKALKCADDSYHKYNKRIMNFVTLIRPLNEIEFLTDKVVSYFEQHCVE